MKRIFIISILLAFFTLIGTNSASAQCRTYTKKKCMPSLKPYIHNGQMNNIMLYPGDDAELKQTFFSGQDYRILVCTQDNIHKNAFFEIKTDDGAIVYSSEDLEIDFWDFNVATTQNLEIHVVIPDEETASEIKNNGCVSVLVGFIHE